MALTILPPLTAAPVAPLSGVKKLGIASVSWVERSNSSTAGNYHAEILGAISLQLIISVAVEGKYVSPSCRPRFGCDNDGVVKHGNNPHRPLASTQSQADALRYLKDLIKSSPLKQKYYHIMSHLDRFLSPAEMTMDELANVEADHVADDALVSGLAADEFIDPILPFEEIVVKVDGVKVCSSPSKAITRHWGDKMARIHFHAKGIVDDSLFDEVHWDGVDNVLARSPEMFSVWVTKQVSGSCATNHMLARWPGS